MKVWPSAFEQIGQWDEMPLGKPSFTVFVYSVFSTENRIFFFKEVKIIFQVSCLGFSVVL